MQRRENVLALPTEKVDQAQHLHVNFEKKFRLIPLVHNDIQSQSSLTACGVQ